MFNPSSQVVRNTILQVLHANGPLRHSQIVRAVSQVHGLPRPFKRVGYRITELRRDGQIFQIPSGLYRV